MRFSSLFWCVLLAMVVGCKPDSGGSDSGATEPKKTETAKGDAPKSEAPATALREGVIAVVWVELPSDAVEPFRARLAPAAGERVADVTAPRGTRADRRRRQGIVAASPPPVSPAVRGSAAVARLAMESRAEPARVLVAVELREP